MSGRATLTTVPSRNAMLDPATATASTQRPPRSLRVKPFASASGSVTSASPSRFGGQRSGGGAGPPGSAGVALGLSPFAGALGAGLDLLGGQHELLVALGQHGELRGD